MPRESRIIRDIFGIVALVMLTACATPVTARAHGGLAIPTSSPVLASVTNTFGNRTIAGYGEERLSRTNQNYGAKYSPYGTGIVVSNGSLCVKWSTSVTSGNASYWNLISHVAEGSGAVTPNLTATGVTNQAGGAGSHTDFLISCEDASNNVLATATLTYAINDGLNHCGAVNLGSTDLINVQWYPTGFASTLDGCYAQFSTGQNRPFRNIINMPFPHVVYLTMADPARPGELANIEMGISSTNSIIKDFMILPNHTNGLGANAAFVMSGTNTGADNIHAYSTAAQRALGSYQCLLTSGTGGTVTNFGCEWVGGFFVTSSNWTYQYGWSRYASADAITTGNGNSNNFHVKDMVIMSMKQPVSNHPDSFQINDGSTPSDYSVERLMAVSAAGDVLFQGPMFGGGVSGIPSPSFPDGWFGFVDDGTGAHGPGSILTVTSAGGMQSNATGSRIFSLSGSPIGLSDGIKANCGNTPCHDGSTFTGTGSGTNLTVSGIAPAPGSAMVINTGDVVRGTGVPDNTLIVSQSSGIAGKNGVYVTSNATTSSAATLYAGPKYTLIGYSGNYGSVASPAQFYGMPSINATWDMIWNSGDVIQGMFYTGSNGTSSATHFTHAWEQTPGSVGLNSPPYLKFQGCAYPIYNGTLTVSKGAEYSGYDRGCVSGFPPTNVTVTDVLEASSNTTTLAAWYVNGDPKTCLEAKSIAQWDALSVQQAMVYAASCTIPKVGGPLDLGGGDVANAIGTALTPTWADGTVVGTGFNGQ